LIPNIWTHFCITVPSRNRVYQALLAELEETEPSEKSLKATIPSHLNEAIVIAEEQSVDPLDYPVKMTKVIP